MSNVNVKVNADTKVSINTSDAIDRLKSLENQYKLLLRQINSSPNTTSLKGYVNNLNNIAQKMRDIASASQGINMSGVEDTISRLSGIGNQLVAQQRQVLQSPTNVASVNTAADTVANNTRSKLQSAVKAVSDSAKSALKQTANIAKSIINTSASLLKSAFSKSLDFIKSKFTSIFSAKQTSGIAGQFKNLLLGAGVVKSIKTMIDYSSSLTETVNRIDYAFKGNADSIKDWAKSNVDSFGLTEGSALKFASTFGGILNSSGVASDEVVGLSENLTEMTGDLSSFYDVDHDVFFKKLQSGLAGNSAALRTFGINVSATNLELYRQSQGIKTAYKDMDQASRVILRYNYIVDSAKDANGDFARTQYTWANQVRLLKQQFVSLGTILGGFFVKSLLPVIQVLNQVFAFAVRAATAVAKLFGFDQESIKDLVSGIGAISDDSAGYIDDTANALGNESDALKDTGKAAKEAAENLQGFDKLNNITTDKSSGASGASGAGASGVGGAGLSIKDWGDGLKVTKEQTEFEKWLDELYDLFAAKNWKGAGKKVASGLNAVTLSLYGKLTNPENRKKIHSFNDAITDFYDGLLDYDTEALGRTVGAGINLIAFSINDLYETASEKGLLTKTGEKIADFFNGLVTGVDWKEVGKAFTTGFRAAMDVLSGFLEKAKKTDLAKNVGLAIKNFLSGAVERLFGDGGAKEIGENISGVVNFALESFATAFSKDADGNSVVDDIADSVLTVINTAIEGIDENDLADALTALLGIIGTLFGMLGDIDTDTLSDKISYAINTAADNGSLSDAVSGIASAILNVFNLLGKTFEKIDWSSVVTAIWKGLKSALETTDGGQYIFPVFATLFGFKLLGKVASWGLHAVGLKIISSIARAISGATATQQISSAFSVLLKPSNLGLAGLAVAVGAMLVTGIKDTVKDRLGNNFFDDKTINKVKSQLSGTLTFTVDPSAYTSLTTYRDKLKELATTYDNVAQLVDDPSFGKDTAASIKDLTAYMEQLKKAGAGGSEAFKQLEAAIDSYNKAGVFDKSSEMKAVKAAAQSLQTEFDITVDTIDSLNDVQFNALNENFSKLKQNTSFSADEVNELTLTWSNAGEQLSKGLLDKVNENVNTDTLVKICGALNCRIEDIMEVVPDEK
jgi:DNA-binding Xre family transcriptional regulator